MTIEIKSKYIVEDKKEYQEIIKKIVRESLEYEGFQEAIEVSVVLTNDDHIQKMNQEFRGLNKSTDVLSFPILEFVPNEIYARNEKGEILLGDIVISMETAKRQSLEYDHSFAREIAFLTAHSMLHLLGYDHMTEEEEKIMFAKQEDILKKSGFERV